MHAQPMDEIDTNGNDGSRENRDGNIALVRYFANGAVDTDFGNNGKVILMNNQK